MSKWDKLIARICNLSKDLRFTQLQKVLETYGYRMDAPRSGSSHYTFRKQGKSPITIPKHEPIKKVYVEMVRKVVESEERENENAVEWRRKLDGKLQKCSGSEPDRIGVGVGSDL